MKNVKVNKDACIGCGYCFSNLEEFFKQDEDGLAKEMKNEVPTELEEEVEDMKDACPVGAIEISE